MNYPNSRRRFLGNLAAGTTLAGFSSISHVLEASTPIDTKLVGEADAWMKAGIKGSHRIVYDGPEPHQAFPIIWTWAYYLTNNQTGTADNDMTGMCVLRHNAIPFAMKDEFNEMLRYLKLSGMREIFDQVLQKATKETLSYEDFFHVNEFYRKSW